MNIHNCDCVNDAHSWTIVYTASLEVSDKLAGVHLLFLGVRSWLRVSGQEKFAKSVSVFLLIHKVW